MRSSEGVSERSNKKEPSPTTEEERAKEQREAGEQEQEKEQDEAKEQELGNAQDPTPQDPAKQDPAKQEQKRTDYLVPDETGAGRPRLAGEGLFGTLTAGDFEIKLGGYFDIEYRDEQDENRTFRFHRLVPLLEARISNRIRFQTEIEIEDGEDVAVEFAHLDYRLLDQLSFRGGVILMPLGKLNLVHDSPIQELTDRPLVDTKVIPTTLRDAGFGFHGTTPVAEHTMNGELYFTTGFRGQDGNGDYLIDRTDGLRGARSHLSVPGLSPYEDNNNNFATTARVSYLGPGFEVGLSGYYGAWDNTGELDLAMGALDVDFSPSAFPALGDTLLADWRFLFEGALADIERDSAAVAGGVPGSLGGWYAQWGWRLPPPVFLTGGDDPLIEEDGGFTLVLRFGRVDLDGARFERTAVGFNFRPNKDRTVFKFEYQWNDEGGLTPSVRNDAFVASIASYF